jgi:hypothetical protein
MARDPAVPTNLAGMGTVPLKFGDDSRTSPDFGIIFQILTPTDLSESSDNQLLERKGRLRRLK